MIYWLKIRQQEQEEYQYKLETTRKLTTDAYEAKKRNLEREITRKYSTER